MFQKIRYRLLLSYLVLFASILAIFAMAVRFVFTRSLTQHLTEKLTTLAQCAAANAEGDEGSLKTGDDYHLEDLMARTQALQWFDPQGCLVGQEGQTVLTLPLLKSKNVQFQTGKVRLQGVTLPISSSDDKHLIGYVRASQSLEELDTTLQKLDWGLGGGIIKFSTT